MTFVKTEVASIIPNPASQYRPQVLLLLFIFNFLLMRPYRDASLSMLDPTEYMETAEEQRVHSPPASLVPRLHMLYARPLPHNNPLLPDNSACEDFSFILCLFMSISTEEKTPSCSGWLLTANCSSEILTCYHSGRQQKQTTGNNSLMTQFAVTLYY